jgi:VIT1/CCC1 family predicted Fe2+/Mn2+ transporter
MFGVLMATSFLGSLSIATAGSREVRTMLVAALGCNLAWGLTDAAMFLVGDVTERHRRSKLLRRLQATQGVGEAHRLIADELPARLAGVVDSDALEALRKCLLTLTVPRQALSWTQIGATFEIFVLVVLSTFPVALPFLVVPNVALALHLSQAAALITLIAGGAALGKYAGGSRWLYGLGLGALGAVLIAAIHALGG